MVANKGKRQGKPPASKQFKSKLIDDILRKLGGRNMTGGDPVLASAASSSHSYPNIPPNVACSLNSQLPHIIDMANVVPIVQYGTFSPLLKI
jgi:hypothetical protein